MRPLRRPVAAGCLFVLVPGVAAATFGSTPGVAVPSYATLVPAAPTGVTAVASCPGAVVTARVVVQWTASVTTRTTGYTILRRTALLPAAEVATVASGATSYTDNALAVNTTYWYSVRTQVYGFAAASPEVQVTTPLLCI